ncbi:MAG TPA: zinc ribbon domain-containing protein [Chloroflexia bacterium]|nr:zinc ribbon domain-containing protein [Chloroflexia bacterium]
MDNQQGQPADPQAEASPAQQLGHQLRKGLDRIGFEADKLLRSNRIRSEATRLQDQSDEKIYALGTKVVEMAERGVALEPELQTLVSQIKRLEAELARKKKELEAITSEAWAEPEPPPALRPAPAKPVLQAPRQPRQSGGRAAKPEQPTTNAASATPAAPTGAPGTQQEAERICPVCKAQVRPQAVFCANCGHRLG